MIKTEIFSINDDYRIVYQTYEYEGLAEYSIWGGFFETKDWKLWDSCVRFRSTPFLTTSFKNKKITTCIFKQKKVKNF
jgi:hypothetical protein